MSAGGNGPRVAIVGGGLAGLAAAVALSGRGFKIDLFEARRQLGGRATSFRDPTTGAVVDHCQHVSMGCCTNLADFCRRTRLEDLFTRERTLHFFSPDGRRYDFAATPWLPAPLHLASAFLRLGYLTLGERLGIARALWRLARECDDDGLGQPTIGQWLRAHGQSEQAIERFWSVVLVSALGETLDRASLVHARKVFVDGFMASSSAHEVQVPRVPLSELYGQRLETWLAEQGVTLHLGVSVDEVQGDGQRVTSLVVAGGERLPIDAAIVAVPWRRVKPLFQQPELVTALPMLKDIDEIEAAPITGIHLWFDRPITDLPHAVLVGTLSQWLFNRGTNTGPDHDSKPDKQPAHYYQVVISASRQLAGENRETVIEQVISELKRIWPSGLDAKLLHARVVTEQSAVFSVRPGIDRLRPDQRTPISNLALAGDWTRTGWPATMEGAVRSGYLAAEAIAKAQGEDARFLAPDLPRGTLARYFLPS
jgi:squalene-associated FAD-dependent desaturase